MLYRIFTFIFHNLFKFIAIKKEMYKEIKQRLDIQETFGAQMLDKNNFSKFLTWEYQ